MPVTIEIQNLQTRIPLKHSHLIKPIQKVLKVQKIVRGQLSFVFVDDKKMRFLNKKYLGHDYATDVLTFDLKEFAAPEVIDGEIIVSLQTAKRNAAEYGTSFQDEALLYMIHGVLHLLGYEDHSPSEIKKMRAQEKKLMHLIDI